MTSGKKASENKNLKDRIRVEFGGLGKRFDAELKVLNKDLQDINRKAKARTRDLLKNFDKELNGSRERLITALGIATKADVDKLTRKIDRLSKEVKGPQAS